MFCQFYATLGDLPPHEKFITEETEWNQNFHNDYISKYGAEMEVWRGQQEGLTVIIIKSSVIIGPVIAHTDWETSGQLLKKLKRLGFIR
jgi:hypothetical protein